MFRRRPGDTKTDTNSTPARGQSDIQSAIDGVQGPDDDIAGVERSAQANRQKAAYGATAQSGIDLSALYEEYATYLIATLRVRFGDGPPDPSDVAHEAFRKVIERGNLAAIGNLKTYIWRTACNVVLRDKQVRKLHARHEYAIQELFFPIKGEHLNPETIFKGRQQLQKINQVLAEMPAKRRRAFVLHRLEGLSVAEVGRRLGIGRTAAAKHVNRATAEIVALFIDESEQ